MDNIDKEEPVRARMRSLSELSQQMATIRAVEETLLWLFSQGLVRGTVHTSIGQEACAVGVVNALDRAKDVICSNHRGHGHFLAYCDNVEGLIAEVMGKPAGVCGGIGGSQHLHAGNFYSNGILAGMVPVATGMALAEKVRRSGAMVVIFLGDGALGEGVVYESFNIASLWRLPILFAVEHNGYAQCTPTHLEHAGRLEARACSFDIPVIETDGNNIMAVYNCARQAVAAVGGEQRPYLLFMRTYRLAPHSKGDDLRDQEEISEHRKRDPLVLARRQVGAAEWERIATQARERVSEDLSRVRQAVCHVPDLIAITEE